MSKISKLLTSRMEWHANMTELNHLGKAHLVKPDVFSSVFDELFTAKMYSDNSLTTILKQTGREETTNSREWEWSLKAATRRPLVIVENVELGNSFPGRMKTEFKIKLDKDWYRTGDILHPGNSEEGRAQIRLMTDPVRQGNGFVYVARLMSDDPQAFLKPEYLAPNTKWAKVFSQYGEASKTSGSIQYNLPLTFRNRMSLFRKMYEVTGHAANEVLAVKLVDSNGRRTDSWIRYAEAEFWQQWYREMENAAWYSRSTRTVIDDDNRPVQSGPGIQEQLQDSHVYKYNALSGKLIREYLMDIFYNRVSPGSNREIKAFTGEYGMIAFHDAIQKDATTSGFFQVVDQMFMSKTSSPVHKNALEYGYQFVKYRMPNGAVLELVHNPLYDDRSINFANDPVTGFPRESQRFTFLDFSGDGVNSNIKLKKKANGRKLIYIPGMLSPYGPGAGTPAAHARDSYEMHIQDEMGVHIEDVSRCGELILNR